MQNKLIKERIEEFLLKDKEINRQLFNELSLYLYCESMPDYDIYFLAKVFSDETLFKLVSYADGEPVILPDKLEFRNNYLVAICFYMKEILGMSWNEIKDVLGLPEKDKDLISSISIGKKINKLKEKFGNDIERLLCKIKITDIRELIKEKEDLDERYNEK